MSVADSRLAREKQCGDDTADVRPAAAGFGIAAAPYFQWKGILDRGGAALLLIPGLPLIGLLTGLVRLTSRGPGMFKQVRVGKNGRIFTMYKIRTMREDAETGTGAVWTQVRDPRITALGRILRKLHLDELPQLFNIVRGEMSLIGPRPERPEFVGVLAEAIPDYLKRLAVLPGVTGLAQINLPPDTDLDSVRRKLVLDLEYIERANLWLDVRMFLATCGRIIGLPGLHVTRLFWLYREVHLPAATHGDADAQGTAPSSLTPEAVTSAADNSPNGDDRRHSKHAEPRQHKNRRPKHRRAPR